MKKEKELFVKVEVTLGEVTIESVDRSGPKGIEFTYVDISSIDREKKHISDAKLIHSTNAPSRAKQILKAGDVLVSMTRPNLNAVAIVPNQLDGAIASTGFHVLRSSWVDAEFLFYMVQTKQFIQKMSLCVQGALYPAVRPNDISSFSFHLPPTNEQHRIVAKIEELFSELDKGIDNLNTARAQLKVYRQALLKHAFEGKLTAQWRHDNQDKLNSASDLQKRIQQERTQRYQQQLQAWESPSIPLLQRGKTVNSAVAKNAATVTIPPFEKGGLGGISPSNKPGSKPKAPKTLPPLTAKELAELPSLPDGWGWAKFGEIFNVYVGATPSRARNDFWNGDIPWVSSGEVAFCRIKKTKEKITSSGYQNTSTEIHPVGTILLAMIGEGKTRGQAAMLDIEAAHNQNTAAIRVSESGCSSNFVYQYLVYQYETTRKIGGGNNQKALNKDRVSDLTLPLCSIIEMNAVSEYLDEKLSVTDQLDLTITTALQQSEALRQSILKKAFSGQLVPQDPNDEPASALLARIKADKLLQEQASKKPLTKGMRHG